MLRNTRRRCKSGVRLVEPVLKRALARPLVACYKHRLRSKVGRVKQPEFMAQHRSLRAASTSGAKRNVLKRYERVELLKKRGQWKQGDRVTGLRKTKPEA